LIDDLVVGQAMLYNEAGNKIAYFADMHPREMMHANANQFFKDRSLI
jgi:hypothetical protein